MGKILHVQATSRGEESFSRRAAEAFLGSYLEAHPDDVVETIDLEKDEIPAFGAATVACKYSIMKGQTHTSEEVKAWKAVVAAIEKLKSADKLVISSPMWNFGIPYRLKQYIDVIVQPGYTFSFSPEAGYKGLVTDKPAMLILARGGEYAPGSEAAALDFQRPYLEWILKFIGFTSVDTMVIEPTLQGGPEVAQQKLDEVIAAAREKAGGF